MTKNNNGLTVLIRIILILAAFAYVILAVPFFFAEAAETETAATLAELQTALLNVDDGGTITITANFDIDMQLNIPAGKNITIIGTDPSRTLTRAGSFTGISINVPTNASLTLQDIILDGNNVAVSNPFIRVNGGRCTLSANVVVRNNNNSGGGGGVSVLAGGTFVMDEDSVISGNAAYNGAALMVSGANSIFNMNGGSITSNSAFNGGGVYVAAYGTFNMYGGSIASNDIYSNGGGGGVYVGANGIFILHDGSIDSNMAPLGNGGGVYVAGTTFNMTGGSITSNTARGNGGGVYVSGTTFNMSGGSIIMNTANSNGGGVYINNSTAFNMTGGAIHTNNNDVNKTTNGTFSLLAPSMQCPHCSRDFMGWYTDAAFATPWSGVPGGITTLFAKYIYNADSALNTISAPASKEAETTFAIQGNGTGPSPLVPLFVGDTQYVPASVQLGSNAPVSVTATGRNFSEDFTENVPNIYDITVKFQKQEWNGTSWIDIPNEIDTKIQSIIITPKSSTPNITGPSTISLTEGYIGATEIYTVTGYPAPTLSVSGLASAVIDTNGTLYLPDGLLPGMYALTIVASNGISPDVSYYVTIIVNSNAIISTTPPSHGTSPQTGDDSNILLWATLSFFALTSLIVCIAPNFRFVFAVFKIRKRR